MKKLLYTLGNRICKCFGVSKSELLISATCVLIGGGYLFYTYLVISVCH